MYRKSAILMAIVALVLLGSISTAIIENSKMSITPGLTLGPGQNGTPTPTPNVTKVSPKTPVIQSYVIVAYNLNSRPSYIVTENGQKLNVVWINPNVGRVEENPTPPLVSDKRLQ
jgi:hypothetical protein